MTESQSKMNKRYRQMVKPNKKSLSKYEIDRKTKNKYLN